MIKFKELRWSNAFSYGKSNSIRLDSAPLTQLVGKNGNGKSSIALIIEEVLFNQNSKGIKKADILNRHTSDKTYTIELDFDKDSDEYSVKTTRNINTGTVSLMRNGHDISSHTSTGTYKTIENILGYDHKTFAQIVYQSSVSSLEFLTATDTARKKFLIELLNLTKYTEASEVFKGLASGMTKQIEVLQAKVSTIESWLAKYEKEDLKLRDLMDEVELPDSSKITLLNNDLLNIDATNKRISQNNTYKNIFDSIRLDLKTPVAVDKALYTSYLVLKAKKEAELKEGRSLINKYKGVSSTCPTCSQPVDNSVMLNMLHTHESARPIIETELASVIKNIQYLEEAASARAAYDKNLAEWEKYHALIDKELTSTLLDRDSLIKQISTIRAEVDKATIAINKVKAHNKQVTEHNSKVKVITEQMGSMKAELAEHREDVVMRVAELTNLQILVKAFSTTGLVAYKIECLVKDLEEITNQYLGVLAGGRFQLSFKIASSDKLNVVITDNGRDISINALSGGERARVNVATLLAIRKLMQSLSNSRTNLLILDETCENLDIEGKEKLVEVLLAEESLNTLLISHSFSHPLLEKINITKSNNISILE